jgi:hemoglobin
MKPDLQTEADVRTVVRAFYGDIEADPALGRFFAGLDWDAHLSKMVRFWSSVVFGTGAYRGRPFDPHARLAGLERAHFARWLDRFRRAVDAHFEGENAERMKARAEQIAGVFQVKLGLWPVLDADAA